MKRQSQIRSSIRAHPDEKFHANSVEIEGIVTRIWSHRDDVLARLAVYDRYTKISDPHGGKDGLPRRESHYVTLRFEAGQAGGQPISLRPKEHIWVSGHLEDQPYRQSLRKFLHKARRADLLEAFPEGEDPSRIRVFRVGTYVIVGSLIKFTK